MTTKENTPNPATESAESRQPIRTEKAAVELAATRLPLRDWALELARRWNSSAYSLFVLHGNIFDLFPVQEKSAVDYVSLKNFLARRIFPDRSFLLFYDIGDGLTFGSAEMQKRFFEWVEI